MADYPLKQEAEEVQEILDGAFLSNKGQVFSEETKAFMREKIGASATGEGLKIISHFDSLAELETAVPNPNAGDAFSVGTALPYNLYIFDFYNGAWRNYGPIRANDIKARFAQNIPVSVGAWEKDEDVFVDYTYKAKITLAEVTGNDFPIVAFAPSDAVSGNFCPISYAFDGRVEIWAKSLPTAAITIPAATFITQDANDTMTGNSTKGITNASGGIATGGIGTEQIANGAITRAKLSKNAVSRVFEAAIGTNWTGSAAPYTQEIAVEGLPDSNRIFAGLDFSDDWETAVKEDEEFNKIVKITAANGNMKVYAEEPTTVQLNVKLTVFTGQGTGGDDDGEGGGSGGSSSGNGVQADWNQTDETAADFIKNKPFGESETVIMEEQELPFDEEGQGFIGSVSSPITIGAVLKVVYNGTTYELITYDLMGMPAFGNATILGPGVGADTGEPFLGAFNPAAGAVAFMQHDLESPTVKISRVDVTKLPSKYNDTQAVFYIGEQDNYLYVDGARTVKATENDLDVVRAKPITLNLPPHFAYFRAINILRVEFLENGKSGVAVVTLDLDGAPKRYYTAEYTP